MNSNEIVRELSVLPWAADVKLVVCQGVALAVMGDVHEEHLCGYPVAEVYDWLLNADALTYRSFCAHVPIAHSTQDRGPFRSALIEGGW